jgi:muramoyltetrapeptide carboxypeptidase
VHISDEAGLMSGLSPAPLRPKALHRGARLGILTPSFPGPARYPERLQYGVAALAKAGFEVVVPHAALCDAGFLSGGPQERAAALNVLIADPAIDGIVCSIGGFNSNDMLPFLDFGSIAACPKVIVGNSDVTALLLAIYARSNVVTFHGPALLPEWGEWSGPFEHTVNSFLSVVGSLGASPEYRPPGFWTDEFQDWRGGPSPRQRKRNPHEGWKAIRFGKGVGRLLGGNIETLNTIVGTPFCPSFQDAILFMEATAEEARLERILRALRHIELAGLMDKICGLVLARCPHAVAVDGVDLAAVVKQFGDKHDIPVAADLDFGHTDPKITLPIGVKAELSCTTSGVSLRLLETAVRGT